LSPGPAHASPCATPLSFPPLLPLKSYSFRGPCSPSNGLSCLESYAGQGWPSVAGAKDGAGATGTLCRVQEPAILSAGSWPGVLPPRRAHGITNNLFLAPNIAFPRPL
jgi:hypothetical protein